MWNSVILKLHTNFENIKLKMIMSLWKKRKEKREHARVRGKERGIRSVSLEFSHHYEYLEDFIKRRILKFSFDREGGQFSKKYI